mmetsp:Transcript_71089/g.230801  ORF Transcript_71089/g.230801 Transcript_71089/m.230801 type:complete len:92 (+) Transcript_71089:4260-4535(+)
MPKYGLGMTQAKIAEKADKVAMSVFENSSRGVPSGKDRRLDSLMTAMTLPAASKRGTATRQRKQELEKIGGPEMEGVASLHKGRVKLEASY